MLPSGSNPPACDLWKDPLLVEKHPACLLVFSVHT